MIKEIKDTETPWSPTNRSSEELPLDGEHYEWNLAKFEETGVPVMHLYTSRQSVATNTKGEKNHRNTVGLHVPELIKLDCGHWGGYKRRREFQGEDGGRQREFGIIEKGNVWLCQYYTTIHDLPTVAGNTQTELAAMGAPLAMVLAQIVAEPGLGAIKLLKYARATHEQDDPRVSNDLFIVFPDLHLPERWPDMPKPSERHINAASRLKLQERLRDCQSEPGLIMGNTLSEEESAAIQKFLEQTTLAYYSFTTGIRPLTTTHIFSRKEFQAEKDIVDRELRLRSTWFYGRGVEWEREESAGSTDWYQNILAPDGVSNNGDPGPAFDLVNLLFAIRRFKKLNKDDKFGIHVVQVGDIFEAWLNREFLYNGFWVRKTDAGSEGPYIAIRTGATVKGDNYQYRMDEQWTESDASKRNKAKRYIYHHVPKEKMFQRHVVGDMIKPDARSDEDTLEDTFALPRGEIGRRQQLLLDRVNRVKDFSMHVPSKFYAGLSCVPGNCYLAKYYVEKLGQPSLATYSVPIANVKTNFTQFGGKDEQTQYKAPNKLGWQEVYWNRLILDLFQELNYEPIYGNHDGYRGDPLLNKKLSPSDRCPGWISYPGIWFEHSHRWDPFNRDGCAFGAGAANLVYYYFNALCSRKLSSKVEAGFAKQEQKNFQPGAALWFLLVNYGRKSLPWFSMQPGISAPNPEHKDQVLPFGIYVSGHTHSGDLVRMKFKLERSARKDLAGEDKVRVVSTKDELAATRNAEMQASFFSPSATSDVQPLEWLKPREK
jgi:hypothetical protein